VTETAFLLTIAVVFAIAAGITAWVIR